ncbi:Uncharacterised protein [Candidatus Norongarragalina meridionalis]|nr:Uncharacterised protein [Candidatus Norongarragalina meridionalis]
MRFRLASLVLLGIAALASAAMNVSPDTRYTNPCWKYDVCSPQCLCFIGSQYCASPDHSAPCWKGDALRCACMAARWSKDAYNFTLTRSEIVKIETRTWNGKLFTFPLRRMCLPKGTKAHPYGTNEVYNLGYSYPANYRNSTRYKPCKQ